VIRSPSAEATVREVSTHSNATVATASAKATSSDAGALVGEFQSPRPPGNRTWRSWLSCHSREAAGVRPWSVVDIGIDPRAGGGPVRSEGPLAEGEAQEGALRPIRRRRER
jgi:hypothetical protein